MFPGKVLNARQFSTNLLLYFSSPCLEIISCVLYAHTNCFLSDVNRSFVFVKSFFHLEIYSAFQALSSVEFSKFSCRLYFKEKF